MDFTKYKCPVCLNAFTEDDDVVVCEVCGTAHHRACWHKRGECFNKNIHGTEEILSLINEEKVEEEIAPESLENNDSSNNIENIFESKNGAIKISLESPEGEEKKEIEIDNEPSSSYASAVGKKSYYYLPRFNAISKGLAKIVWNGASFLVPFAWSLYRKLYGAAAIIFALYIAFFGIFSYTLFGSGEIIEATLVCAEEDPEFSAKILSYANGESGVVLTPKQTELAELIENVTIPVWLQVLNYIIVFGTRMFMGLKATQLYKNKIASGIKKARLKGLAESELKMFLARKYGTFPIIFVAIAAFFEIQIFLM